MEIFLTETAEWQLHEITEHYAKDNSKLAMKWFDEVIRATESIELHPESHKIARESESLRTELRQLLFGVGRAKTHRILFVVRPNRIVVHQIRHVAQKDIASL